MAVIGMFEGDVHLLSMSILIREVTLTAGGEGLKIGRNLPSKFCDPPY